LLRRFHISIRHPVQTGRRNKRAPRPIALRRGTRDCVARHLRRVEQEGGRVAALDRSSAENPGRPGLTKTLQRLADAGCIASPAFNPELSSALQHSRWRQAIGRKPKQLAGKFSQICLLKISAWVLDEFL
jgi:hypothetical protein